MRLQLIDVNKRDPYVPFSHVRITYNCFLFPIFGVIISAFIHLPVMGLCILNYELYAGVFDKGATTGCVCDGKSLGLNSIPARTIFTQMWK